MYRPREFRVDDREVIHSFMQRHTFGVLVTVEDGVPVATHLPFVLCRDRGEQGALVAHVARANLQWRTLSPEREALAIFEGPHAYVSPSWYEPGLSVPTWDYMVVHAYGRPRLLTDEAEVREYLRGLVERNEAGFERPWRLDLPEEYFSTMTKRIVAFEIELTRLEGKFKLSQNRTEPDRRSVAAMLAAAGEGELSRAMLETLRDQSQQ